jgi:hypothetical protein
MATFSSNLVFKLKALGIYQLISAIAGLLVTFSLFLQDGFQDPEITIIIIAIILTLYLFAIYCGISCFQMKNKCLLVFIDKPISSTDQLFNSWLWFSIHFRALGESWVRSHYQLYSKPENGNLLILAY